MNKCQSTHPLERSLFVHVPLVEHNRYHNHQYHHHQRQEYLALPPSPSPSQLPPKRHSRLCLACVCATVRNAMLLETVRKAAVRQLHPLLCGNKLHQGQHNHYGQVMPKAAAVTTTHIPMHAATYIIDRLLQAVVEEGERHHTRSSVVDDITHWLSAFAFMEPYDDRDEHHGSVLEYCLSKLMWLIMHPSSQQQQQKHQTSSSSLNYHQQTTYNIIFLFHAICSTRCARFDRTRAIVQRLMGQCEHQYKKYLTSQLVSNMTPSSTDDYWLMVCQTVVFLLDCQRYGLEQADFESSVSIKTRLAMMSSLMSLIHAQLPCRRSTRLEMAYLSIVQAVLGMFPSNTSSIYVDNDASPPPVHDILFPSAARPRTAPSSLSQQPSSSSSVAVAGGVATTSPFLSILRKTLLSTVRAHVDVALEIVSLVSCDAICNEHGLFDYVMETLRGATPNLNALRTIVALAQYADWTKWAYVLPIVMQCIQIYSRQQQQQQHEKQQQQQIQQSVGNTSVKESTTSRHPRHTCGYHQHLISIVYTAFLLAPVQAMSAQTVQNTCAFVIRLYMQRRVQFAETTSSASRSFDNVGGAITRKQRYAPHAIIDEYNDIDNHHHMLMQSEQSDEVQGDDSNKVKEMNIIRKGIDALLILLQRYDISVESLRSVIELSSLGCDPNAAFIRSSCINLFVICVKHYRRLVAKYFHHVNKAGEIIDESDFGQVGNTKKCAKQKKKQMQCQGKPVVAPKHHPCVDVEVEQMKEELRNLGDVIIGNIAQSWMIMLHARLSNLQMALAFFHRNLTDIIAVFQLFTHVLDPIFSYVGCQSVLGDGNVTNVQRWCWENLSVRLVFQVCEDVQHDGIHWKSYRTKRGASDYNKEGDHSRLEVEKTHILKIISQYLRALLMLDRVCSEAEDDQHESIFLSNEKEFIAQLSCCPSPSSLVSTRLLQMGIKFRNMQCICQPDSIISALSHRLHQLIAQSQTQYGPYQQHHASNVVEALRYIAAITAIHHMQFPSSLICPETMQAFITIDGIHTEVDFLLFLKFISASGLTQAQDHKQTMSQSQNQSQNLTLSQPQSSSQNLSQGQGAAHQPVLHGSPVAQLWELYVRSRPDAHDEYEPQLDEWDRLIMSESLMKHVECVSGLVDAMINSNYPYSLVRYVLNITSASSLTPLEKQNLFGNRTLSRRLIMLVTQVDEYMKNNSIDSSISTMFGNDVHRVCAMLHFLLEFHYDHHHYQYYSYEQSNLIPVLISILPSNNVLFPSSSATLPLESTPQYDNEYTFLLHQLHSSILRFIVLAFSASASASSSSASSSSSSPPRAHIQLSHIPTHILSHCILFLAHAHNNVDMTNETSHVDHTTALLSHCTSSSLYRYAFYSPSSFIDLSLSSVSFFLTLCLKDSRLRDRCYKLLCTHLTIPRKWDRLMQYTIYHENQQGSNRKPLVMTESEEDLIKKTRIANVCKLLETFVSYADKHDATFSNFSPFVSNQTLHLISSISSPSLLSSDSNPLSRTTSILTCVRRASHMLLAALLRVDPIGFKETVNKDFLGNIMDNLLHIFHGYDHENNDLSVAEITLLEQLINVSIVDVNEHIINIHNILLRQWNFQYSQLHGSEKQCDVDADPTERTLRKKKQLLSRLASTFLAVAHIIKRDKHSSEKRYPELVPEQSFRAIQQHAGHSFKGSSQSNATYAEHGTLMNEGSGHLTGVKKKQTPSISSGKFAECNSASLLHDEAIIVWEH